MNCEAFIAGVISGAIVAISNEIYFYLKDKREKKKLLEKVCDGK